MSFPASNFKIHCSKLSDWMIRGVDGSGTQVWWGDVCNVTGREFPLKVGVLEGRLFAIFLADLNSDLYIPKIHDGFYDESRAFGQFYWEDFWYSDQKTGCRRWFGQEHSFQKCSNAIFTATRIVITTWPDFPDLHERVIFVPFNSNERFGNVPRTLQPPKEHIKNIVMFHLKFVGKIHQQFHVWASCSPNCFPLFFAG